LSDDSPYVATMANMSNSRSETSDFGLGSEDSLRINVSQIIQMCKIIKCKPALKLHCEISTENTNI